MPRLLGIAALDLTSPDPTQTLPDTAEALADLAEAALEAALVIAHAELGEQADHCRLSVIGMGKTGGRELNYVSDVDVIFVAEPADGADETSALAAATALATNLMRACSTSTAKGTLWPVDAALRPEGKQGPLVPSAAPTTSAGPRRGSYGHCSRPGRWPATASWGSGTSPTVSPDGLAGRLAENFVEDVQAMRRRVRAARARQRGRPAAQAQAGVDCATSSSACSCSSWCTAGQSTPALRHHARGPRRAGPGRVRRPRGHRHAGRQLPPPAHPRAHRIQLYHRLRRTH